MLLITGVPLNRRVRTEYARARLTEATYEAAIDALHPSSAGRSRTHRHPCGARSIHRHAGDSPAGSD
jgi:hypothetical protein